MSDVDEPSDLLQELLKKQKNEKKELQAKIQRMKQLVMKNEKKKRKELNQEIEQMEANLKAKHDQEMKEFEANHPKEEKPKEKTLLELQFEAMQLQLHAKSKSIENEGGDDENDGDRRNDSKVSKAQKRREKKEREERERQERIIRDQSEGVNHVRQLELDQLNKKLRELKLKVFEISADGDCLYKAVEHQLKIRQQRNFTVKLLRSATAEQLKTNKYHYLPFLTSKDGENLMSDDEFDSYCDQIENTKCWGGNVELKVLASFLNTEIHVIQADGPIIKMRPEVRTNVIQPPLLLSYHRFAYQLGEHYNSLLSL